MDDSLLNQDVTCDRDVNIARVLFVDDDPFLISGLRRMMRKYRDRWDSVFAQGGPAGLAEVRKQRFDVVISDMRMPGVEGACLMAGVRDLDPTTFRIILSGFIEPDAPVRTELLAHLFLDKPCASALIVEAIERGLARRYIL